MNWYRVDFGGGEPVVTQVEKGANDKGEVSVLYAMAETPEEALKQAREVYSAWCRERDKQRRAARRLAGLCQCGEVRMKGREQCKACTALAIAQRTGNGPTKRNDFRTLRARYDTLNEVREAWVKSSNVHAFAEWLKTQIVALKDVSDKALEPVNPIGEWKAMPRKNPGPTFKEIVKGRKPAGRMQRART
jgi:hypothetical protein